MKTEPNVKLISWNVNGIRAVFKKGFHDFVAEQKATIYCLQEVKAFREQVETNLADYAEAWHAAKKPGYSGTATFSKIEPRSSWLGLKDFFQDDEGRVVTTEFSGCYLVNVYIPNAQRDLARMDFKIGIWMKAFHQYLAALKSIKPIIICGDLNVARHEIDLANPKTNLRSAGFTIEERTAFEETLSLGLIDTFREFEKGGGHYTWWSYRPGVRARNIGWRIDYFLISESLRPYLRAARILPQVMGSDHCPVVLEMSPEVFL